MISITDKASSILEQLWLAIVVTKFLINKPYANEHAARLTDPGKYKRFARQNDKGGPGIDFVFGITEDGKTELQAIRFDSQKFTLAEAKAWVKEHDHKPILFEEAKA